MDARRLSDTAGPAGYRVLATWLAAAALFNLVWEILQLPLYTLYRQGAPWEIAYAIAHCTAGDVLIGGAAYAVGSLVAGTIAWPRCRTVAGLAGTVLVALAYTVFSEWLNVNVRQSWAYSEFMPQLFGIGVSPLLQWIAVPAAATLASRVLHREGVREA